jgi:hypothetical protein
VLPPFFESDKSEALSLHVETLRLNGVCTMDLITSMVDMGSKLYGEVDHLKNDDVCLRNQLKDLQDAIRADKVGSSVTAQSSLRLQRDC